MERTRVERFMCLALALESREVGVREEALSRDPGNFVPPTQMEAVLRLKEEWRYFR